VSYEPYLNISWGHLGAAYMSSRLSVDGQKYTFPTQGDKTFSKFSALLTTEMSIELEKIWGTAKQNKIPLIKSTEDKEENKLLIGKIPILDKKGNNFQIVHKSAFKHSQLFLLKHYYTTDSKWSGDKKFYQQIQDEEGVFDYRDSLVEKNYLLSDDFSRTSIPLTNTLELQWNNSLTEKSLVNVNAKESDLRTRYQYNQIAYFNISQGYVFDVDGELSDHLSRLNVATGAHYGKWSFFINEYFFYKGSGHLLDVGASYQFPLMTATTAYNYNYFSTPVNRRLKINIALKPIDLFSFDFQQDYDLESKEIIESNYRVLYTPGNNCWRLSFGYRKTLIKASYALNFLFNFGGGTFSSFQ
jgi:LPS-assembly protein